MSTMSALETGDTAAIGGVDIDVLSSRNDIEQIQQEEKSLSQSKGHDESHLLHISSKSKGSDTGLQPRTKSNMSEALQPKTASKLSVHADSTNISTRMSLNASPVTDVFASERSPSPTGADRTAVEARQSTGDSGASPDSAGETSRAGSKGRRATGGSAGTRNSINSRGGNASSNPGSGSRSNPGSSVNPFARRSQRASQQTARSSQQTAVLQKSSMLSILVNNKSSAMSGITHITQQTNFQTHPGMTFEAIDEDGNLVPLAPEHVQHYRFFVQVIFFAFPYTFSFIAATFFVPPGYKKCNLGQDLCDVEYILSTVTIALICNCVAPFASLGHPGKFMKKKTFLWYHFRFVWVFIILMMGVQYLTGNDPDLIFYHVVLFRIGVASIVQPWGEIGRLFLDYEDGMDSRKCFATTPEKGGLMRLIRTAFFASLIAVSCMALAAFSTVDAGWIATGEWGDWLKTLRPIVFIAVKKLCYTVNIWGLNHLEEPVGNAAYLRQYGMWWIHIQIAMANCLAAANCEDWMAFLFFWGIDLIAFVARLFVFGEFGEDEETWLKWVCCCFGGAQQQRGGVKKVGGGASGVSAILETDLKISNDLKIAPSAKSSIRSPSNEVPNGTRDGAGVQNVYRTTPGSSNDDYDNIASDNNAASASGQNSGASASGQNSGGSASGQNSGGSASGQNSNVITAAATNSSSNADSYGSRKSTALKVASSGSRHLARTRNFGRQGKPTAVGEMVFKELLGWDLIIEGVALQVAYTSVIMVWMILLST